MPIYEYQCRRCGRTREVLHKISETPSVACEHCPDEVLERQVSAAAFRLKGGGWYETDFKKDGQRNLAGGDSAAPASESSAASAAPAASSETSPSS